MFSVNPIRDLLAPRPGLMLALGGSSADRSSLSISFFMDVEQKQPGREKKIVELYDTLRPSLSTYLGGLGLSANQAEDVIHDTFIHLLEHLAANRSEENLRGWLFRVAHHVAMDFFRDGRKMVQSDDEHGDLFESILDRSLSPEEIAIRKEELRRVDLALERLTPQQRAAVLLRAEELRYREIAIVLGVSTKRVGELIQRGLARLAGDL
jgi:RNA polymerase sigma-70 factor, ECF subfamily